MRVRGHWPKYGLMLASLAAGATTLATPASAEFFFRPFFGSFVERIEVDPWPAIAPRRVAAILARRGFRLAQPPYYGDDEIVAIGVDARGGHTRFVLDPDDGEVLERRRLDRGYTRAHDAPVAARRKPAIHAATHPAPRQAARPQAPSAMRADPSAHPRAAERPPADAVRPAAAHVPPTPSVKTPAAPAAAATTPTHPAAPAPDKAPAAPSEAPQSPAANASPTVPAPAPAAPAPAADWKAPSE